MARYRVTYNDGETEDVEADDHAEVKGWIVFSRDEDDDLLGPAPVEVLRIKGSTIIRVELIDPA